jgi:hypothetical protein
MQKDVSCHEKYLKCPNKAGWRVISFRENVLLLLVQRVRHNVIQKYVLNFLFLSCISRRISESSVLDQLDNTGAVDL